MDEDLIEYFKDIFYVHGQSSFGVHELSFDELNQTSTLSCWGCDGTGYSAWEDGWKEHFVHNPNCQYLKFLNLTKINPLNSWSTSKES